MGNAAKRFEGIGRVGCFPGTLIIALARCHYCIFETAMKQPPLRVCMKGEHSYVNHKSSSSLIRELAPPARRNDIALGEFLGKRIKTRDPSVRDVRATERPRGKASVTVAVIYGA